MFFCQFIHIYIHAYIFFFFWHCGDRSLNRTPYLLFVCYLAWISIRLFEEIVIKPKFVRIAFFFLKKNILLFCTFHLYTITFKPRNIISRFWLDRDIRAKYRWVEYLDRLKFVKKNWGDILNFHEYLEWVEASSAKKKVYSTSKNVWISIDPRSLPRVLRIPHLTETLAVLTRFTKHDQYIQTEIPSLQESHSHKTSD